ncbi:MAG: MCE-family protein Mce1D [Acidimicrobiales bacterium]|nr:MCE-family protein Mce1D [Acidimicrobiales bacterium]
MGRRHPRRLAAAVAVALATALALLPACSLVNDPPGPFHLTAEFSRGTGLYPGSPVRVLGIDVGRITKVDNARGHVRVRMRLDRGTRLPADARATIVPLTLLGERYVQLGPAYTSGARMQSGAAIPLTRTSVPAEFDDLLRGLQSFIGSIDPKRAGDVVTDLADVLQGQGSDLNRLIANASGTLGLLADKGDELRAIIRSLGDLSKTLRGHTDNIESLIRNYDLVAEVLVQNKDDLDATITQFDRTAKELSSFLAHHEDPLRSDVGVVTAAGRTLDVNTDNLKLTLHATVKLFEAADRAYDERMNALDANNQVAPDVTSAIVSGRLRDRIAGLCRRLGIDVCSDPASPLLNGLASTLPGILGTLASGGSVGNAPASPPPPGVAPPVAPELPKAPTQADLLDALAQQLTHGLDAQQARLLGSLDPGRLTALLGLDPTLLQVLPDLDASQLDRLRQSATADLPALLLALTNEVHPPASRLDPLLPGSSGSPTTVPGGGSAPSGGNPLTDVLGGLLGGH